MWSKLAMALLRGDLSPAIDSMKVSPRDPPTEQGSSHVLLVYNEDYQDKTQVFYYFPRNHFISPQYQIPAYLS